MNTINYCHVFLLKCDRTWKAYVELTEYPFIIWARSITTTATIWSLIAPTIQAQRTKASRITKWIKWVPAVITSTNSTRHLTQVTVDTTQITFTTTTPWHLMTWSIPYTSTNRTKTARMLAVKTRWASHCLLSSLALLAHWVGMPCRRRPPKSKRPTRMPRSSSWTVLICNRVSRTSKTTSIERRRLKRAKCKSKWTQVS